MAAKKFGLSVVMSVVDKITAPMKKINGHFSKFEKKLSGMKNTLKLKADSLGLTGIHTAAKGVGDSFKGVNDSIKKTGARLAVFGAMGVGAFLAIKSSATGLSDLGKLSKTVDVNVKSIQAWRYAAERAGGSAEDIDSGMKSFTKSMGDARAGGGSLLGFLKTVNPAFAKQLLGTKNNEEAFNLMMKAMEKVKDPQKKLTLAMTAFGGAGEGLARVSQTSSEKLAELRKEAEKLGMATEDDVKNAQSFEDGWKKITYGFEMAKNTISAKLFPVITLLFEKMFNWIQNNQDKIIEFATMIADKLPIAIEEVSNALSSLANSPVTGFIMSIIRNIGTMKVVLAAVAAYIFGPMVLAFALMGKSMLMMSYSILKFIAIASGPLLSVLFAIGKVAFSVGLTIVKVMGVMIVGAIKALWAAMLSNPITAIIAGVFLLIVAVVQMVKHWDKVKKVLTDVWDMVKKITSGGIEKISKLFGGIKSAFGFGDSSNQKTNTNLSASGIAPSSLGQSMVQNAQPAQANVSVSFDNLPKGARVETKKDSDANLDLSMGYSMQGV